MKKIIVSFVGVLLTAHMPPPPKPLDTPLTGKASLTSPEPHGNH